MVDGWRTFQEELVTSRKRRGRRKWAIASLVAALGVGGYVAGAIVPRFGGPEPRPRSEGKALIPSDTCRDVLCRIAWPELRRTESGVYEQWVDGHRIVYTLDPELQEQALSVLRQHEVPYGAFVAVEPATGKVLALAEYSRDAPKDRGFCGRATYPAASLVKLVTAAAALATGKVGPDTEFRYEGNPYRLSPRKISASNGRRENNVSTLAEALAKSNNVVFAKLGVEVVGVERLEAALGAFGFNRPIPFDFRIQASQAAVPRQEFGLGETAAGFGDVYLSPIHAALIGAAVGNRGLMMQPYLVDTVEDSNGKVLYRTVPAPLARSVDKRVAQQLARMMEKTVTAGTSAKVFSRYAPKLQNEVGVAGKTGSLTGQNPPGMYEWFVGFAPIEEPKIAVASLVVNRKLWQIKGTYVAQAVMKEFFGL